MNSFEKIDVEEILQEIRADIIKRGYKDEMLSFNAVNYDPETKLIYDTNRYKDIVHNLNCNWDVAWYREIPGNRMIRFIKKIIRKLCAFIIRPMSEQQVIFNENVKEGFNQLVEYIDELEGHKRVCEKDIRRLEERLEKLEDMIKQIKE